MHIVYSTLWFLIASIFALIFLLYLYVYLGSLQEAQSGAQSPLPCKALHQKQQLGQGFHHTGWGNDIHKHWLKELILNTLTLLCVQIEGWSYLNMTLCNSENWIGLYENCIHLEFYLRSFFSSQTLSIRGQPLCVCLAVPGLEGYRCFVCGQEENIFRGLFHCVATHHSVWCFCFFNVFCVFLDACRIVFISGVMTILYSRINSNLKG